MCQSGDGGEKVEGTEGPPNKQISLGKVREGDSMTKGSMMVRNGF